MRPAARTAVLALLLGGAVGAFAAVYLRAVHLLEDLLWDGEAPRLPLDERLATVLLCVVGGVLVGLIRTRHDRELPHDLEDALLELDDAVNAGEAEAATPPPSVRHIVRAAILGIVSLGFGASLGPEAPLLVITVGLSQRMARILHATRAEAAYISSAGALSGLFGGPLGAVVLPVENGRRSERKLRMMPFGLIAGAAGLVALLALLPDASGHPYALPDSLSDTVAGDRHLVERLLWAALAAVPATFTGLALLWITPPVRRAAERLLPMPVPRAAVGGLVLGLCGAVAPLTLFSGQHQAQALVDDLDQWVVWGLLGLIGLKLIATLACLATGWFGGQIFPAVFMGMVTGLAIAVAVPSAPVAPLVAAAAGAATAALLRRPFASALLLLFYFPADEVLALTLGAAVAMLAVQLLGDRAPAAQSFSGGH